MTSIGVNMAITGRTVLAGGLMGLGFMCGPAQATVYNWTFQDFWNGTSYSGQFDETGGTITSFSGDWAGVTISGLSPAGTLDGNDNLYPLTSNGVAFALDSPLSNGSTVVRLYDDIGTITWFGDKPGDFTDAGYGTFTATAVPEPASAALLGAAVAGLLAGARRRRVKAAAAA